MTTNDRAPWEVHEKMTDRIAAYLALYPKATMTQAITDIGCTRKDLDAANFPVHMGRKKTIKQKKPKCAWCMTNGTARIEAPVDGAWWHIHKEPCLKEAREFHAKKG